MKNQRTYKLHLAVIFLGIFSLVTQNLIAQPVVGVDNWFNRETNAKTGQPFHYLWTDTEFSGYSQWGEIFKSRGAEITTVGKPEAAVLKKKNFYIIVDPDT